MWTPATIAVLVTTMAAAAEAAQGQAPREAPAARAPASTPASAQKPSDQKLPVSLERIRRELMQAKPTESERFENFRLLTSLHVYGQAPEFELFAPGESVGSPSGAARYGSVTHQELLAQVTPREFRPPVMNLSGGLFSLSNWIADKRREAQRRKETEERQRQK
jgi:hypothetical protein